MLEKVCAQTRVRLIARSVTESSLYFPKIGRLQIMRPIYHQQVPKAAELSSWLSTISPKLLSADSSEIRGICNAFSKGTS
jgi:hypothetical protein